jgi:hypothetical protein
MDIPVFKYGVMPDPNRTRRRLVNPKVPLDSARRQLEHLRDSADRDEIAMAYDVAAQLVAELLDELS